MPNTELMTKHERNSSCDFIIRHLSIPSSSVIRIRHCNHHALAPIAQIGVRFARADSRPMSPAAGAFFVRRFRYRSARLVGTVNRQITQNKKFLQFFLWDSLCDIGIRIQNYAGFQSVADQFLLACTLDRLPDDGTQSQKLLNLLDRLATTVLGLRKLLQMDRTATLRY